MLHLRIYLMSIQYNERIYLLIIKNKVYSSSEQATK
jgi:hypothetical protein